MVLNDIKKIDRFTYLTLFLLFIATIIACGSDHSSSNEDNHPDYSETTDCNCALDDQQKEAIDRAMDLISGLDCQNNPEDCELIAVNFKPENEINYDTGENILIIDSGMELQGLSRYRGRVLDYYRLGEDNLIVDYSPEIEIKKYLNDVYSTLSAHDFIPTLCLQDVSRLLYMKDGEYLKDLDSYSAYHGKIPFSILLEYNPKAKFVILKSFDFINSCGEMIRNKQFEEFERVVMDNVEIIKDIIDQYQIHYINYSVGHTIATIKDNLLDMQCENYSRSDINRIVSALMPFYEVLFESEGVLGIQAGAENVSGNWEAFPFDAADFKNRIRVGYLDSLDSNVDENGHLLNPSGATPKLSPNQENSKELIDVFICTGSKMTGSSPLPVYNKTPLLTTDKIGTYSYPASNPSTSWVAPMGLSRVIHIKNTFFKDEPLDEYTIGEIKRILTPEGCDWQDGGICKIQDPLRHNQFEAHRLGYEFYPYTYNPPTESTQAF